MPSFEEDVNTALKGATKDEAGKTVYPEGTLESTAFAANAESRRRDTQSALTKAQQENTVLSTENGKLASSWAEDVSGVLTDTQRAELEELKATNPDEWRQRLNEHEATNAEAVKTKREKITADSGAESELTRRESVLEAHNAANPDHQITNDTIENDIPPRMTNKLASGEITFDDFLVEASGYLSKDKVVSDTGDKPGDKTNLSDLGGNDKPTTDAVAGDIEASYANEIY
jgi:hypothetical protein